MPIPLTAQQVADKPMYSVFWVYPLMGMGWAFKTPHGLERRKTKQKALIDAEKWQKANEGSKWLKKA